MRNQERFYQVMIGILVVVLFTSWFACWKLYDTLNIETSRANDAESKAKEANDTAQKRLREAMDMKELTGFVGDAEVQFIKDEHIKDMERYAKFYGGNEKTYRSICESFYNVIDDRDHKLLDAQRRIEELDANLKNTEALYKSIADDHDKARADALAEYNAEKENLNTTLANRSKELEDQKTIKEQAIADAEKNTKDAEDKVASIEERNKSLVKRNLEVVRQLTEITRVDFDHPAGKITGVSQAAGMVYVNLGKADGLQVRTTFTVYDPTITGISFPSASGDAKGEKNLEHSKNASKASLEITKILSDHTAEGRILNDELQNPILVGDLIYTPLWKPGQLQRFALANGMVIKGLATHGDGEPENSSLTEIINLIQTNGGVVDAYIDTNDEQRKIVGEITQATTYLVVGDTAAVDQIDEGMKNHNEMIKTAEERGIRIIKLNELLRMMGYRDPTPVVGFGKYANESDHTIPTQHKNTSSGKVSPYYDKDNEKARVTTDERPKPVSSGIVAPLYSGKGATAGKSGGSVSDLFRPRKPPVTSEEVEK
ncbi:MAG: hypothetical protein LBU65_07615 [Planctomycetaceae bacterium]|jgi:hypothetical protein|nr:hypothetical protein [Planctomycetaceae bacterium]